MSTVVIHQHTACPIPDCNYKPMTWHDWSGGMDVDKLAWAMHLLAPRNHIGRLPSLDNCASAEPHRADAQELLAVYETLT